MWSRSGLEVTAVPPVSNSCADMNMQMGKKAATGVHTSTFGISQQFFGYKNWRLLLGAVSLMRSNISRVVVGWRCLCPEEPTQTQLGAAAKLLNWLNPIMEFLWVAWPLHMFQSWSPHMSIFNHDLFLNGSPFLLLKASALSNIKHSWSYLNGCLFFQFF